MTILAPKEPEEKAEVGLWGSELNKTKTNKKNKQKTTLCHRAYGVKNTPSCIQGLNFIYNYLHLQLCSIIVLFIIKIIMCNF